MNNATDFKNETNEANETNALPWRFIVGHGSYADFSISVSPAVERAVAEGISPPTVYLNIFDGDSITIGVNEDPHQVLDLEFCRANGISTRRRVNGGGAIYAGKGSAFLSLYLPASLANVPATAAEAFPKVLGHVAASLEEIFDLKASYRPLNDVEIDGRKLVATSLKIEGGVMTFRILLNIKAMNTALAAQAMPMAPEKVRDKKHKDLGSRYTYLEQELQRPITHEELIAWVDTCIRRAFGGVALQAGQLSPEENTFAQQAALELTADAWFNEKSEAVRYGPLMLPGDRIGRGRRKAPAGLIWLSLLVRDGRVVRAIINGDWHPRPTRSVDWLEEGFVGLTADREACGQHIEAFMKRQDVEFAGVEAEHLMDALGFALDDLSSKVTA
jgi:lipoate-protein ligase A